MKRWRGRGSWWRLPTAANTATAWCSSRTPTPLDGRLDLVAVAGGSALIQFWRARRLAWRPLAPAAGVHRARVKGAIISGDRMRCHVDGEPFDASGSIEVRLAPGALRVAGVA